MTTVIAVVVTAAMVCGCGFVFLRRRRGNNG